MCLGSLSCFKYLTQTGVLKWMEIRLFRNNFGNAETQAYHNPETWMFENQCHCPWLSTFYITIRVLTRDRSICSKMSIFAGICSCPKRPNKLNYHLSSMVVDASCCEATFTSTLHVVWKHNYCQQINSLRVETGCSSWSVMLAARHTSKLVREWIKHANFKLTTFPPPQPYGMFMNNA